MLTEILDRNLHLNQIMGDPNFDQIIEFMANRMMIVLASPEEILIKEGDSLEKNDAMYFIASGSCIVEQKDIINYNSKPTPVGNLQTGDYFGVSPIPSLTFIGNRPDVQLPEIINGVVRELFDSRTYHEAPVH